MRNYVLTNYVLENYKKIIRINDKTWTAFNLSVPLCQIRALRLLKEIT